MIGLSVSRCIKAMARGDVKEKDVEKIIAGVRCINEAAWDSIIAKYKESYWKEHSKKAEKLLRKFLKEERIEQPRLGENPRAPMTQNGIWVNSEDEIEWQDETREAVF